MAEGIVYLDVDGCDLSPDMIALCRETVEREGLTTNLYAQPMHAMHATGTEVPHHPDRMRRAQFERGERDSGRLRLHALQVIGARHVPLDQAVRVLPDQAVQGRPGLDPFREVPDRERDDRRDTALHESRAVRRPAVRRAE